MQRLDKFLSDFGIGTRKQIKEHIKNGAVTVNGQPVKKADMHIDENADKVVFMGQELVYEKFRYYMLNKPDGVISATRDGRTTTVLNLLKDENVKDLSPVGRLDIDTEGLLLITNDGQLIHRLLSPSHHVDKEYEVHLKKELSDDDIDKLTKGVDIGDVRKDGTPDITLPAVVKRGDTDKEGRPVVFLTIHEGRFHQVKRMMEAVGNEVLYLRRIRMGAISLDESLELGQYRRLTDEEIKVLTDNNGSDQ